MSQEYQDYCNANFSPEDIRPRTDASGRGGNMTRTEEEGINVIKQLGFDSELADNLIEIVRLSVGAGRKAAIEECARVAFNHNGRSPKDSRDIAGKIRNLS